jgi:hypothetical protein
LKASNDKTPFSIFEESKDKDIAEIGSQDFRKLRSILHRIQKARASFQSSLHEGLPERDVRLLESLN